MELVNYFLGENVLFVWFYGFMRVFFLISTVNFSAFASPQGELLNTEEKSYPHEKEISTREKGLKIRASDELGRFYQENPNFCFLVATSTVSLVATIICFYGAW